MQHAEAAGRRGDGEQRADQLHEVVRRAFQVVDAAVAGAVHAVVELGIVERVQLDPQPRVHEPFLGDPAHGGHDPRVRQRDTGVERTAHRERAHDEQQRRQRGEHPVGGRPFREQLVQHAGRGQQPEREREAGGDLQHEDHQRRAGCGLADDRHHRPQARRQPAHELGHGQRTRTLVEAPVRAVHLQLGLGGHLFLAGPGSGSSTDGSVHSGCRRSSW